MIAAWGFIGGIFIWIGGFLVIDHKRRIKWDPARRGLRALGRIYRNGQH